MNRSCINTSKACRILAIDDESEVRNAYQHALTFDQSKLEQNIQNVFNNGGDAAQQPGYSRGFNLSLAQQGSEAVAQAQQALAEGNPFTVAFIDMRMPPGMDGLETAKALRTLDDRIYIVFVTAYSDRSAEELDEVMEHEILLLRKPFVNEEIYQLARSLSRSWQKDRELEQALELAEQANRAKDQFMAAMSHEFRTPLSSLLGYGELLSKSPLNEEQLQLLQQMNLSGKNLLYRINDVLDATKLQSGRLELHPAPFSLSGVIDELQEIYLQQLQMNSLQLSIRCQLTSPDSRIGDRPRLLQILSNLLGNAIKFTPKGKIEITLNESQQGTLAFTIEDSGIGMSNAVLESAFHPFEQGDKRLSRSYSGIGMGLHISLQLAQSMGGTLEANSQEGQGSRFTLTLPLPAEQSVHATSTESTAPISGPFSGRVLVVEDTPEMQLLIQRILESHGAEVTLTSNGKEGMEQALALQYDLILMDLQMPVMGGIEATSLLRQIGYTAPIIALTANVTDSHRQQFLDAGGDDFLTKPIEQQPLIRSLQRYLQQSDGFGSPPSSEPLIDDSLMQIFTQRTQTLRQTLSKALHQQEWDEVHNIAHTIKGSGTTFGFPQLTQLGREICDAITACQFEQAGKLTPQLLQEMENVI